MRRAGFLVVVVMALGVSACSVGGPGFRNYGVVHTRLGDAVVACGGEAGLPCGEGSTLVFGTCSSEISTYFGSLSAAPAARSRLDARARALTGRTPPTGGRWVLWTCNPDFVRASQR
jgi:hypothetical protein